MNILEMAKSITKEDIKKADEFLLFVDSQIEYKNEASSIIGEIGFKSQAQIDVVFFMKWMEYKNAEIS